MRGGGQERGLRPGTENVAGAVGLATALELRQGNSAEWAERAALRDRMTRGAGPAGRRRAGAAPARPRAAAHERCAATCSCTCWTGDDIAVAAGSACSSGDPTPSHVLVAMGLDADVARGALRVSLGPETSAEDVDAFVAALGQVLPEAARMLAAAS